MNEILWIGYGWTIQWFDPSKKWRGFYVSRDGHGEHPCIHPNGISWDRPEVIPERVKRAVGKMAESYALELQH